MLRSLCLSCLVAMQPVAAIATATECWSQAAQQYGVSAELLYAVARAESDLNPAALNVSHKERTGTYDIGLMQINSSHLRRLAAAGISEKDLYDPCTNIRVGAWLMAHSFARHGVSWNAVGAYNAACTQLKGEACTHARAKYAWRVYRRLPSASAPRPTPSTRPSAGTHPVFILSAKVSP
jgi:soluble lytic murein transglycosylase-like protein